MTAGRYGNCVTLRAAGGENKSARTRFSLRFSTTRAPGQRPDELARRLQPRTPHKGPSRVSTEPSRSRSGLQRTRTHQPADGRVSGPDTRGFIRARSRSLPQTQQQQVRTDSSVEVRERERERERERVKHIAHFVEEL
ncbi:hypothetical protein L3Q82_020784 [Scortum barcoo]|uniref:Uncharacterized protein n=1 Tax=Scortum barcoo TaxID=214431 RepID=A0ACB8V923_9TELE|nr:hypothetical protein L3Q82_020784 [Scortum barcoo]